MSRPSLYYKESDKDKFNSLPDEVKEVLRGLNFGALYYGCNGIKSHFQKNIEYQFKVKYKNEVVKKSFAFGLLHSIVFNQVICSLPVVKLFKEWTQEQIQFFFNCYVCSQLRDENLFSIDNILSYYLTLTKKTRLNRVQDGLKFLSDNKLISEVSEIMIYEITGKHKETNKKNKHYYKLTRKGALLMEQFIKVYEVEHKKITGNLWTDDLVKLNTKIDENL